MNSHLLFSPMRAATATMNRAPIAPKRLPTTFRTHLTEETTPELLWISTFPPRECGIATYSQDLIDVMDRKFGESININICPIETSKEVHSYPPKVRYRLNIDETGAFDRLADAINGNPKIAAVLLQHEFGLFAGKERELLHFLGTLDKPILIVFHTVLPMPSLSMVALVLQLVQIASKVIVMTHNSKRILGEAYRVPQQKIAVIPHGTHLVDQTDKALLKAKYGLQGRTILSTFGLLSAGKNIETSLQALPDIIKRHPEVLFLIIGKTHPAVVMEEGERYRHQLTEMIETLNLNHHVKFVNAFLPLDALLEHLQLTDIYLFTSKDPYQAVSGTFSYAISCGCPVVSTPIPHAVEVLDEGMGFMIDFESPSQLAAAVLNLLANPELSKAITANSLHKMAATAWENSAISHALLLEDVGAQFQGMRFAMPKVKLQHIQRLTTGFGMIQFSKIQQPDIDSGYTLDDNARALIAMCAHYELTLEESDLPLIKIYLHFIEHCLQENGEFLNYVNDSGEFSTQNAAVNLADANGRAIWALGYLVSLSDLLPDELGQRASTLLLRSQPTLKGMVSPRGMAFAIKGLYYYGTKVQSTQIRSSVDMLAKRLENMYLHEQSEDWNWFEGYLTYGNSVLSEAMLCAWRSTGRVAYGNIARQSFNFLLAKTFAGDKIKVISNKTWLHRDAAGAPPTATPPPIIAGEQPIEIAYTVLALSKFDEAFPMEGYRKKKETAFSWFLGNNHLHRVIYNPATGGCYDGLEPDHVNLNQGAESTVSYLMARLAMEMPGRDGHKQSERSPQRESTAQR